MSCAIVVSLSLLLLVPSLTSAQGSFSSPSASSDDEKNYYSRRYDSLDVDTIFRSQRLLNNYVDCLLDKKPCPPEGKDLKRVLPHALRTKCARCTKIQKAKALDVITRLYYQHPSVYIAIAERYDPLGEYTKNFENWFDEQNGVKPRPPIPDLGESSVSDKTQQTLNRRSPALDDSTSSSSVNSYDYAQRTRIPSTWITTTTTTASPKPTTTRAPLRTSSTIRPTKVNGVNVPPSTTSQRAPFQPPNFLVPIFPPRPEGNGNPISQSINKLLDTTGKVVNGFADMFRSTIEILTG